MARHTSDTPGPFALLVAAEIRREMGDMRMSGRALAQAIGKSEKYVRERVNNNFEFSLNDIEAFCQIIGVSPEEFIYRVESSPASAVDVSGMTDDQLRKTLALAANTDKSDERLDPDLQ
jgi:transcriptional regulator with XRE-family HTH domain